LTLDSQFPRAPHSFLVLPPCQQTRFASTLEPTAKEVLNEEPA